MVKLQVTLFFISTVIITTNTVFISSDFKNVWHDINDKLHEILDDVFILLKINANFTKSENVADGLLLNNFIQNVSARNYKKYEKMYNLSQITVDDNKTAYFIFIINEMIEEFLMQERNKLKPHISVKYYKNNVMNSNSINLFTEKNITFYLDKLKNEFNSKVEKTIIKDIVYKLLFANPKKSWRLPEEQDLKFWGFNMSSLQTRRVFNGQATSVKEFPFMVSVHIEGRFCCAGSIIRKEFVITAASCLRPFHTAQKIPHLTFEVRIASDFASQYGELVPVAEMHFHPHFNHESLNNNLVILKLKKRLKFNDKVRKIMFDDKAYKMPENVDNILILGWGPINMKLDDKVETTRLSYAFVDVYNLQECKNVYSSFYVKDKNFCTGYVSKGSGACQNDIGGPAVVGSTLTGVISYGSPHCGQPDAPTVFTKLGYYADWINSVFEKIPQEYNDIEKKSRFVSRPSNFMTHPKSVEDPNNIKTEIKTLAQLIGKLQVVKHINSTLNEFLREKKTEENNIITTTDKDNLISKDAENDVFNEVNVLQLFSQDSVSTTPESITIPVEASEYENSQKDESAAVSSKESKDVTTDDNIYKDLNKEFISGYLDSKSSPTPFADLTTHAEGDAVTELDEWPRTRFDSELLKGMTIFDDTDSHFSNDTNSEYKSGELIDSTPNFVELQTSNVPKSGSAEQDQLLEIVFLESTPVTRLSVKETTLPSNLPLIYHESSSTRKSYRKPVKSESDSSTEGSMPL